VKEDRVSIKDDQKKFLFTVTMEDLRRDDTDMYWCGIERIGIDLGVKVNVIIDPGKSVDVLVSHSCEVSFRVTCHRGVCVWRSCTTLMDLSG
jgi:hypothetical protein